VKTDLSGLDWRKAHRSAADGACVEVARLDGAIVVRDSLNPSGPMLTFGATAWHALLARLKV
jgi:hypothetical protein